MKARVHLTNDIQKVKRAAQDAIPQSLDNAALAVEARAKELLSQGGGGAAAVSAPGTPPHTQSGALRSSIGFARDGLLRRIVGPNRATPYGRIHEFGGVIAVTGKMRAFLAFKKGWNLWRTQAIIMPERPYMRPALAYVRTRFASMFAGLLARCATTSTTIRAR